MARDGRLVFPRSQPPGLNSRGLLYEELMELNYQDRRFLSSMRIASDDTFDRDLRSRLGVAVEQPGFRIREADAKAPPALREVESAPTPSDRYLTVLIFVIGMLLAALTGYIIGMAAR